MCSMIRASGPETLNADSKKTAGCGAGFSAADDAEAVSVDQSGGIPRVSLGPSHMIQAGKEKPCLWGSWCPLSHAPDDHAGGQSGIHSPEPVAGHSFVGQAAVGSGVAVPFVAGLRLRSRDWMPARARRLRQGRLGDGPAFALYGVDEFRLQLVAIEECPAPQDSPPSRDLNKERQMKSRCGVHRLLSEAGRRRKRFS